MNEDDLSAGAMELLEVIGDGGELRGVFEDVATKLEEQSGHGQIPM